MMEVSIFKQLLTSLGQEAIQAAMDLQPRKVDFLPRFQALSRTYPPELAKASVEIAILRGEAQKKFPAAHQMYFTREALEQATRYAVSRYRAQRYSGFDQIIDLGCSIGGDSLSLSEVAPTIGIDLDPLRIAMAQANLKSLNLHADFIQADIISPFPFTAPPNSGLFFDPARRSQSRRITTLLDYLPPISIIHTWSPNFSSIGAKISPGVQLAELNAYDCEIEFISLKGELKEAVLWFGELKTTERRATVLPGAHTMIGGQHVTTGVRVSEPAAFLYEPDPAILRAGLVQDLAIQLDTAQLDPDIAYLTAATKTSTPFARVWEIEDWFPFQLKRLRTYLRERNIGRVVIKKRGSPLQPENLIRDLKLKGELEKTIVLTHLRGRPIVIICQ